MATGHADHFLSRLDRVTLPQTELALSLYRDDKLVKEVLRQAALPDGAERVALSLEHPTEGPFVLVTREGRFVTCLGAGMSPAPHPVVTWAQLDVIARRVSALRAWMGQAARMMDQPGRALALVKRMYSAGDTLTREEFRELEVLQPLMTRTLWESFGEIARETVQMAPQILKVTRRREAAPEAVLRTWWETAWTAAHLTPLLAVGKGRSFIESLGPEYAAVRKCLSWVPLQHGLIPLALRGVWCVARIGRTLLPSYKGLLVDPDQDLRGLIDAVLDILALGLRHSRLRAEVRKALSVHAADRQPTEQRTKLLGAIAPMVDIVFDHPEQPLAYHWKLGADRWIARTGHLPPDSPWRYDDWEQVPEDLARTVAVNDPRDFFNSTQGLLDVIMMLPWVARAEAADLYLPAAEARVLHTPWRPEKALALLDAVRPHLPPPEPVQAARTPGRNDPCHCGSGKKYKKCHLGRPEEA